MTSVTDKTKLYARMQIETSAKPRIICILHEKCVQFIRQSIEPLANATDTPAIHAQNILAQLERSLKREDDISDGLFYLYDYCYCLLETPTPHSLQSALAIMTLLRDTFEQLHKGIL